VQNGRSDSGHRVRLRTTPMDHGERSASSWAGTVRVGGGSGGTINFVQNDVPAMAVAAIFQKEAAVLIAHPDAGINSIGDMKGHPIAISRLTIGTWWRFLANKYGFEDTQIRPYTFQIGPFLVDKNLVQQGYVTSEPFAIENEGHFTPKVFLLADDAGYPSYARHSLDTGSVRKMAALHRVGISTGGSKCKSLVDSCSILAPGARVAQLSIRCRSPSGDKSRRPARRSLPYHVPIRARRCVPPFPNVSVEYPGP
jgi:NMT1/THI5 like